MALRIVGVAPKVGDEKGVALKVGEKAAPHLTPLHAPVYNESPGNVYNYQGLCIYSPTGFV